MLNGIPGSGPDNWLAMAQRPGPSGFPVFLILLLAIAVQDKNIFFWKGREYGRT